MTRAVYTHCVEKKFTATKQPKNVNLSAELHCKTPLLKDFSFIAAAAQSKKQNANLVAEVQCKPLLSAINLLLFIFFTGGFTSLRC